MNMLDHAATLTACVRTHRAGHGTVMYWWYLKNRNFQARKTEIHRSCEV